MCDSRRRVKVFIVAVHHRGRAENSVVHQRFMHCCSCCCCSFPLCLTLCPTGAARAATKRQKTTKREITEPRCNRCELKLSCLAAANVMVLTGAVLQWSAATFQSTTYNAYQLGKHRLQDNKLQGVERLYSANFFWIYDSPSIFLGITKVLLDFPWCAVLIKPRST